MGSIGQPFRPIDLKCLQQIATESPVSWPLRFICSYALLLHSITDE